MDTNFYGYLNCIGNFLPLFLYPLYHLSIHPSLTLSPFLLSCLNFLPPSLSLFSFFLFFSPSKFSLLFLPIFFFLLFLLPSYLSLSPLFLPSSLPNFSFTSFSSFHFSSFLFLFSPVFPPSYLFSSFSFPVPPSLTALHPSPSFLPLIFSFLPSLGKRSSSLPLAPVPRTRGGFFGSPSVPSSRSAPPLRSDPRRGSQSGRGSSRKPWPRPLLQDPRAAPSAR